MQIRAIVPMTPKIEVPEDYHLISRWLQPEYMKNRKVADRVYQVVNYAQF